MFVMPIAGHGATVRCRVQKYAMCDDLSAG